MSTDTAFALGALALLTPRAATRLRVFLLTLAVVDDLGALLVIADGLHQAPRRCRRCWSRSGCSRCCSRCASRRPGGARPSVLVGVALWVAMFKSGIDPVIAGLAIGLVTSAYPPVARGPRARDGADALLSRAADARAGALGAARRALGDLAQRAPAVRAASVDELRRRAAVRARQRRHPRDRARCSATRSPRRSRSGSSSATSSASRSASSAPRGLPRARRCTGRDRRSAGRSLAGGGAVAGIGFTVSLLISGLAFHGERLDEAKLGVLASAILAPLVAWAVFSVVRRLPQQRARAPDRGHRRGPPRPRPTTSTPSATTSAGPDDAPVTLVEYGDFECPFCGQAESVVRELLASSDDDVRYVWRHLPLNDVHAQRAARGRGRRGGRARRARSGRCTTRFLAHQDALSPQDITTLRPASSASTSSASGTRCAATSTRRASPRTSPAPTPAASRARPRSSSTAAATTAPTTSTRSARPCARRGDVRS